MLTREEAREYVRAVHNNAIDPPGYELTIPEHSQVTFSADGTKVFIDAVVILEIPSE